MNPWLRRNGPLLILLLLTTLAYARLWWVGWSWDDEALILDNQVTGSLANVGEFFTRDLWGTTRLESLKSGYYRPLFLLSLAIDRALFDLSSTAAHVHSLLWHLLVVVGLHGLIRKLVTPLAAITAATMFALHPVNSEVLALVAARNDEVAVRALIGLAMTTAHEAQREELVAVPGACAALTRATRSPDADVAGAAKALLQALGRDEALRPAVAAALRETQASGTAADLDSA